MKTLLLSLIFLVTVIGGPIPYASADGKVKKRANVSEPGDSVNYLSVIRDENGNQNLIKTIGVFKVRGNNVWFELGAPISNKKYKTIIPKNNTFDFR